ncbi:MAG: ABC transporter permease [Prevotella sp.]|nr:ABC transporter permease [Prevotella sp.]
MNFPLFIARRIHSEGGERQKVSLPAIRIATAGIAIGLAVMIISVSVVLGFKHTIRDKVVGFGSHITVANFMAIQSDEQYPIVMNDSMMKVLRGIEGVRHAQRFAAKQGILKTDDNFMGILFKGIAEEYDTTFLHQNLVSGSIPHFSSKKSSQQILISKYIADKLRLKTGDRIFSYFIATDDVRVRRFTISGIYETNLAQFDKSLIFTDLYTTVRLNGWEEDQAGGAELQVSDFDMLNIVADRIIDKVNRTIDHYGSTYSSETIKESVPNIFAWLDLLNLNVWIILALMVSVAGFTMISGLLIIILERTNMIGILKALGARNSTIRHTFLYFSVFIIGRGLVIGDIIALTLLLVQKYTGIITLDASTYYVSTVPVEFHWLYFLLINIATLLICTFVLIAPSYLVSHIHPAKSMRYE